MANLIALPVCVAMGALLTSACGGGVDSERGRGDAGDDSSFLPASPPALPQVISNGGPVLAAPKVQLIAYAGDEGLADMNAFLAELTTTKFWSQATSEYGVGELTVLPTIMGDPLPKTISDAQLASNLAANTSGAQPLWGPADSSTIYLFLLPPGTIESDSQGSCCSGYDGYHSETMVGYTSVPYAVSCACPGFDGPGVTDLQERTVNVSHELVEAATDPLPYSSPAYTREDDADLVWTLTTVGEVADMCEFNDDAYYVPPDATYMIQRTWSDRAAAQVRNPCVPVTTTAPYFNSIPALDVVRYPLQGGGSITTHGLQLAMGASVTVDVNLFSEGPLPGPWKITAYDYGYLLGGTSNLALSLDKTTGQNGDAVHLTIRAISRNDTIGGEAFVLYSEYGQQGQPGYQNNLSMGLVLN